MRRPFAYLLSALAAVVYILATIALVAPGRRWYAVAWATISFELLGVLVVGALSVFDAELFPADTVWSFFGRGYLFIPLVLPILGMLWLQASPSRRREAMTVDFYGSLERRSRQTSVRAPSRSASSTGCIEVTAAC